MLDFDHGAIKHYRKLNNMRQDDLARFLNCTGATISRWESGVSPITAEQLAKFADLMGLRDMNVFFVIVDKEGKNV